MKKCLICGIEHEGPCDKSKWDGIFQGKFSVPNQNEVSYIEDKALEEFERQHIAKKRGRPPKNGG